jgi:hypothetical protein
MTAKQNQKFPFHFFFRFAAEGWGGRRREKNARKFFGFCTRESASVSEAHWFASPRNRSVRGSFKPPRAPRVRSGFVQRLIHHRRKKLPNPKGGKKPAPSAREWAKEPVASRRIGTGRVWRTGRICPCFISKNYLYVQAKIFSLRSQEYRR